MVLVTPKHTVVAVLAGAGLFLAGELSACSIPVFRYALERWQPDPYGVEVRHRGPLSPEGKAAADLLTKQAADDVCPANAMVRLVDAEQEKKKEAKAGAAEAAPGGEAAKTPETDAPKALEAGTAEPPETGAVKAPEAGAAEAADAEGPAERLVVYIPVAAREPVVAWDQPLTRTAVQGLLDSPVRADVAKRLIAGDAAVWLLLEIGDKAKDDAAFALLEKELGELEKTLMLPLDPMAGTEDEDDGAAAGSGIRFSILRLKRDDPKEAFFVASLLRTEPDLGEFEAPMVFPVFGRGRALYALVGRGVNIDNIRDACEFLVGACSCQVKAQNPGVDLLMSANWGEVFEGPHYVEDEPPPLTGVMPTPVAEEETTTPGKAPETGEQQAAGSAIPVTAKSAAPAPAESAAPAVAESAAPVSVESGEEDAGAPGPAAAGDLVTRNVVFALGAALVVVLLTTIALRRHDGE